MDLYSTIEYMGPIQSRFAPVDFRKNYDKMVLFRHRFGYAVPSREAIEEIASWSKGGKILELGAGRGLWARLLKDAGADVEASDPNPPDSNFYFSHGGIVTDYTFTKVLQISGEDHAKSAGPNDVLMLVWPSHEDSTPEDWQQSALRNFKGRRLVFVGEGETGCTGSPSFWREINHGWKQADKFVHIPTWVGIHDYVMFFSR